MRTASLLLLAMLGSATPMAAQSKGPVRSAAPIRISGAEVNADGTVKILFSNGRSAQLPPEKGQTDVEQVQVATSGSAAGWLVVDVPIGSYSVPSTLTVYTVGKPLKHFGNGLMLVDWDFVDDDRHIWFSSSQPHGPGANWLTMEVQDIETGRLLKRWSEQSEAADPRIPLASITGRVTDGAGAPLADAVVTMRAHPAAKPFALTTSSAGGQFTLQGIQPGEHELRFDHRRFKGRAVKITVRASEDLIDAGVVTLESRGAPVK